MPVSFWFFLSACIVSFAPIIKDHGEGWKEYKSSQGKAKKLASLWVFALWAGPIITAIGTVVSGFEAISSGRENAALVAQAGKANEKAGEANLAAAEANERSKHLENTNLVLRSNVTALELKVESLKPENQPIESASGDGYVIINPQDPNLCSGIVGKKVIVELNGFPPTSGAVMAGRVSNVSTNPSGIRVGVRLGESDLRSANTMKGVLSFNSLKAVRLNLFPESRTAAFEVKSGAVYLELSKQYEFRATFGFPPQTNQLGGIAGVRDWPFAPQETK